MLNFLFCEQPFICCRCGGKIREGEHVFRNNPDYDDAVMCRGCTVDMENEYVMLNGNLCASTEFMDESDFDYGYYEIKKHDGKFLVSRFRHADERDFTDFYFECDSDNIALRYDSEGAALYLDGTGRFLEKGARNEAIVWAEDIFGDCTFRMIYEDRRRMKRKMQRVFSPGKAAEFFQYCRKRIIGQDSELKKAVYMVIEYAESIMSGNIRNIRNWMLTAPSGSGKTEFYRSVRDFFRENSIDIPVILFDLSRITPSGYKGAQIDDIAAIIAAKKSDGKAIVFLDEADKKFLPDGCGSHDDFNAMAQSCILSFTEGCEFVVPAERKGETVSVVDTSKTMFVFMGAFQYIRDEKSRRLRKPDIGFSGDIVDTSGEEEEAFYENITVSEMIEYGLTEQLAGRISQVINFHRIPESEMRELIRTKAVEISYDRNIYLGITDSAVEDFLKISYTHLGVRAVINRINELVSEVISAEYFGKGFDESRDKVIIRSGDSAEIHRAS